MKKETILLVEDTKSVIDLINEFLIEKGFAVSVATNGIQALEVAPKLMPSLILMDILMPGMDGYETCRLLKQNQQTKHIPVIFISALTKTFDKVKAFQVGGIDYISKPIETDELLARLQTHLTISRLQKELKNVNEKLEEKVKLRTSELEETNLQLQASISELFEKTEALEKSEERYKLLVSNIMYPVLVSTFEGKYLFVNQKAIDSISLKKEEIYNSTSPIFWLNPTKRNEFIEQLQKEGSITNKEVQFKNAKGETITAMLSSNIIDYYGQNAILSIYNDITQQKELEKQILNIAIETEEKERLHFAQELHDGLAPLLSAAKMYLQWTQQTEDKNEIPTYLDKALNLVDDSYRTAREISHLLSPHVLQAHGLIAALKNIADKLEATKIKKINITHSCEKIGDCMVNINIQKQTILYRVLLECINNTLKHANATEITINFVKLNTEDSVEIIYTDNGIGFDLENTMTQSKGIGLVNLKNRIEHINGSLFIYSKENEGVVIKIII